MKHYRCDAYPEMRIGSIKFQDGMFATDDPAIQAMIEGRPYFGARVYLVEVPRPRGRPTKKEMEDEERS